MRSDDEIKTEGMLALRNALGLVEAEKFVLLIKRDSFDYTEWQTYLWEERSVDDLFNAAKDFKKKEE